MKLATAARLNATFPLISPPPVLPAQQRRRVVDAGFYDNYGIDLAARWLYLNKEVILRQQVPVILIQIRSFESDTRTFRNLEPTTFARGLEFVTGPVQGLLSAWRSAMIFRNDSQLEMLEALLNRPQQPLFAMLSFDCKADVPLTWFLTKSQQRLIWNRLGPYAESIGQLKDYLSCRMAQRA